MGDVVAPAFEAGVDVGVDVGAEACVGAAVDFTGAGVAVDFTGVSFAPAPATEIALQIAAATTIRIPLIAVLPVTRRCAAGSGM